MNAVSEDTMSIDDHGEAYMISVVAGVVVFVISIVLNFVGSTAQPVGNMVPIQTVLAAMIISPREATTIPINH